MLSKIYFMSKLTLVAKPDKVLDLCAGEMTPVSICSNTPCYIILMARELQAGSTKKYKLPKAGGTASDRRSTAGYHSLSLPEGNKLTLVTKKVKSHDL